MIITQNRDSDRTSCRKVLGVETTLAQRSSIHMRAGVHFSRDADRARSCRRAIGLGPYAGKRGEIFSAWNAKILDLATCPNVHIKLGGLGMRMFGFTHHLGELPPSSEELATAWRPYIETCIAASGPQRAMFESNFPVDKGS
jgi:hypothetical protein